MNVRVWLPVAGGLQKLGEGFISENTAMGIVFGDVVDFHFLPGQRFSILRRRIRTTLWQYQGDIDFIVKLAEGDMLDALCEQTKDIPLAHHHDPESPATTEQK